MIQDIEPKKYHVEYADYKPQPCDRVLVFAGHGRRDDQYLVKKSITQEGNKEQEVSMFPTVSEFPKTVEELPLQYLFSIDEERYFLLMVFQAEFDLEELPGGYTFLPIRFLRASYPADFVFAGATGYHLFSWYRDNRFCGRCGAVMTHDAKERAMRCTCGNMVFPKIAPAVIVGVRNGDSLLMSRYAGREYTGTALIAGFCEIGETPEETVRREVMEEVGLKVKNITYYKSQPWGQDMNLLLGYYCDLDGNDTITMDTSELATAGFVKREDIESDGHHVSLTNTMIQDFKYGKDCAK